MLDVNSKILWLSDFELSESPGGAQRSDDYIIKKGKELGFNILKVNYNCFSKAINIHDYDCVISSNVHAITQLNPWVFDELIKHKYHVRIEHDSNEYLSQENRIKLFSSCKRTFFLTDYHHSFFKESYGNIFKNVEIIPDPIDISKFYNKNQQRQDKILYVGYMHPQKGAGTFFEYVLRNPDKQFAVAGWSDFLTYIFLTENIKNIEYLGIVDHEKMPDIYNKYKSMYYEPTLREPFCRSVAEAILCGTLLLTKNAGNIGCLHDIKKYGIDKFKENCNTASYNFWNKI